MANMLQIPVGESKAERRKVFFALNAAFNDNEVTTAAGSQPQISINGSGFTGDGISTLTHVGSGQYYATLEKSALRQPGDLIVPIIAVGSNIYEGDNVQVVGPRTNDTHDAYIVGATGINMSLPINKLNRHVIAKANGYLAVRS